MTKLLVLLALALGLLACDASRPCVYTARLFHADKSCLDPYAPIGLVQADELGANCDPVCLERSGDVYVSTVCAPYPSTTQLLDPAESPECGAALSLMGAGGSACE